MLKASALYIVIIIALVIGVLCSALIVTAYFYREQYLVKFRTDHLQNNIVSGINILLTIKDSSYRQEKTVSLFDNGEDSVSLQRLPWGIFDIGSVRALIRKDTLYKVFSIANTIDSAKWAALYLIDEDRPLSLSGQTAIRGDAYIPKAGVKTAYVDNQSYTGDKTLVQGRTHDSERKLPPLAEERLHMLIQLYRQVPAGSDPAFLHHKITERSFLLPTLTANLNKQVTTLENISLSGNIIIYSDTTLIIDSTAKLRNIMVFAKAIRVEPGFHGTCQLYARDSISIARDCYLEYPSCIGVLRDTSAVIRFPEKISLGENTRFSGLIFTYEKTDNPLRPIIALEKNTMISGQVYSQGILSLKAGITIRGNVMTNRFLYQSQFTAYENYLIGATIDATALSRYYLTSELTPVSGTQQKILKWLEVK